MRQLDHSQPIASAHGISGGMAADPYYVEPFDHLRLNGGKLIVSRCNQCGLVVAASPREAVLYLAERIHTCPVYMKYDQNA